MHARQLLRIFALSLLIIVFLLVNSSFEPAAAAGPWYVAPGGDDSNDCLSTTTECASINGVVAKAGFAPGDTIYVAPRTYTSVDPVMLELTSNGILSGGWDSTFSTQSGINKPGQICNQHLG